LSLALSIDGLGRSRGRGHDERRQRQLDCGVSTRLIVFSNSCYANVQILGKCVTVE